MKTLVLIFFLSIGNSFAKKSNKIKVKKMYQKIKKDFKQVPELSLQEVDLLKNNVLLIDVREDKERKVSMIPGAISKEDFEKNKETYTGKKLAVYCTIGYRSAKYVKKLKKRGIEAFNLEGSILGWIHEGKPVVDRNGEEVKRVHVYGRSWNHLPKGFKAEW